MLAKNSCFQAPWHVISSIAGGSATSVVGTREVGAREVVDGRVVVGELVVLAGREVVVANLVVVVSLVVVVGRMVVVGREPGRVVEVQNPVVVGVGV